MTTTQPTSVRRRNRILKPGCILALVLLCLAVSAAGWFFLDTQSAVKDSYGAPAAGLNPLTQFYYSLRLRIGEALLLQPVSPGGAERIFEVRKGESAGSVAYRLETAGLIPDADTFRIYLIYTGLDRSLQAGRYKLSQASTAVEIAQSLRDATPEDVILAILPGWRLEEVAASLPTSGLNITPEEFMAAARTSLKQYFPGAELPETESLEGFLFPGEYVLPRDASVEQALAAPLNSFIGSITADVRAGFEAEGLSLFEAVTLASIVEREAIIDDEQPVIASVFYNRLDDGMKLDSDPTVQYALGYDVSGSTWWTNPLSAEDLQIDSPYNTYLYQGLPPGPIANPGLPALRAVAFPAETPYYYFRAKCDGSGRHEFAVTLAQHLNNACN